MARNDRTADDPAGRGRRRRRPPTLELEATEVGAQAKPRDDRKAREPGDAWPWMSGLKAVDWRALAATPSAIAAVIGALVAVLTVLVLVPLLTRGSDPRIANIADRLTALSARVEAIASRPPSGIDAGAVGERLDRLSAAIGETERRLTAIESRPAPPAVDLAPLATRVGGLETALKDLSAAVGDLRARMDQPSAAVTALAGRVTALEERVAGLSAPPASTARPVAAEIGALNALLAALASGRPFAQELAAARTLLAERAAPLAAFQPDAERGLPTISSLAQQFAELAPALVRAPSPNGGFFSRLYASLAQLVDVRPVGEPEGKDVGAVVARMETKLARGDLAAALGETALLPERARPAAANWIAAASRRRDAEAAVRRLIDAALLAPAERAKP